ncbi:hypothetical protein GEMRC1_013228 [Eukaryota sp. GEM-RC1]
MKLLSLRARVFHPNTRIYVRLLGPCFKTGQLTLYIGVSAEAVYLPPEECQCQGYNTTNKLKSSWLPSSTHSNSQRHSNSDNRSCLLWGQPLIPLVIRYFNSLFRVLSPFPHGTCELSVSNHLASLRESYSAFNAAFPNSATSNTNGDSVIRCHVRDFQFPRYLFSKGLYTEDQTLESLGLHVVTAKRP